MAHINIDMQSLSILTFTCYGTNLKNCACFSSPWNRYLTLFMNLLNDCSDEEQDKAMDPNRKRSMSDLSSLRNCTVQAMSNLLNANIDSGLMHSIGLYIFFLLNKSYQRIRLHL